MPIGSINKEAAPKRETFRPPWVKDKDGDAPPAWTQRKLKPVDSTSKSTAAADKKSPEKTEAPTKTLQPVLKKQTTVRDKENGDSETVEEKLVKPSQAKQADKVKSSLKTNRIEEKNEKTPEKSTLKSGKDDKSKEKTVTIIDRAKPSEKVAKTNSVSNDKVREKKSPAKENFNDITIKPIEKLSRKSIDKKEKSPETVVVKNTVKSKTSPEKTVSKVTDKTKPTDKAEKPVTKTPAPEKVVKPVEKPKEEDKAEDKTKMATKPPIEKSPSKLPPRKPSLQKQMSKEDAPVKKWRDPLHERVKENIDKTLANEVPKGHTLTKNESLRSLLKPTPPPMPPPLPPKLPPPPEFKKPALDPDKLKKLESLRSRPRRRPDWSDMMKEVEEGKKLKKVVCNDRSSPVITRNSVVKNKGQFIFESEKPNAHNDLLKEINKGIRLKKTKTNDRSKPNLEGLRKFRRQMTIEEQVQKSMSQANLATSPSGVSVAEVPGNEEEDIDEMDDIDKVRDDLQSTKQLLAIELRNKEAQERENKRLLTRIQNLEAELARERAIIRQEQHKTVISVTDAYDERLVNSLKSEVDRAKETADNLEKQYLEAAEERDTAYTELEEVKRQNAELEKKLAQALSNNIERQYVDEEPKSFYVQRQLDFEKQCRLLNIDVNSEEAQALRKTDSNNNNINRNYPIERVHVPLYAYDDEGIMPSNANSRRSSHAIKQLSVQKDSSFEEEEESEEEGEESEEKKQKRLEKDVKNMRNKIRHLKEKQDNMKRERAAYKVALKNQQCALKDAKRKYKELKRDVDKMASMMKEVGSDEEEEEEESSSEEEEEKKSESEESETETEADTESETESESEPEDAPLPNKKENLTKRVKRHETRVHALKKGNALLMANVDRLKDDVNKQREESVTLQKELDSLIEDFA